ncbi:hypothetical protein E2C01_084598 [Portunus trituberculatus]|uniref:Uncharacterized protein n=1 Tax=Portunus trituberculatus TaxID=210409 RepID=A0A5B7JB60_PORTR|nr:hypothetical protein [Portunus trituberculatus]
MRPSERQQGTGKIRRNECRISGRGYWCFLSGTPAVRLIWSWRIAPGQVWPSVPGGDTSGREKDHGFLLSFPSLRYCSSPSSPQAQRVMGDTHYSHHTLLVAR